MGQLEGSLSRVDPRWRGGPHDERDGARGAARPTQRRGETLGAHAAPGCGPRDGASPRVQVVVEQRVQHVIRVLSLAYVESFQHRRHGIIRSLQTPGRIATKTRSGQAHAVALEHGRHTDPTSERVRFGGSDVCSGMRPVDVQPYRAEPADRIVNEQRRSVELGTQRVDHHAEPLTIAPLRMRSRSSRREPSFVSPAPPLAARPHPVPRRARSSEMTSDGSSPAWNARQARHTGPRERRPTADPPGQAPRTTRQYHVEYPIRS
jgi:hypothetical protein